MVRWAWSPIRKAQLGTKLGTVGSETAYKGFGIVIPAIAGYEVRGKLIRAGKGRGIGRLDALSCMVTYAAITTPAILKAAELWATAGKIYLRAADGTSLAAVIVAAQAAVLANDSGKVVIATANVRHLAVFWPACL